MDRLFEGVEGAEARGDVSGTEVTSIEFDSRAVTGGSLFFCLPGARSDGHLFAAVPWPPGPWVWWSNGRWIWLCPDGGGPGNGPDDAGPGGLHLL